MRLRRSRSPLSLIVFSDFKRGFFLSGVLLIAYKDVFWKRTGGAFEILVEKRAVDIEQMLEIVRLYDTEKCVGGQFTYYQSANTSWRS